MSRSKKIFAFFVLLFALVLLYLVYDISSRTTFPGQRPKKEVVEPDSIHADSISHRP
jgi:hypothetical protein